jgi:hypothetical protein
MTLPRLSRLEFARFFGLTLAALVVTMAAWWASAAWLTQPISLAARMLLHATSSQGWLASSSQWDRQIEVHTRLVGHPTAAQLQQALQNGQQIPPDAQAVLTVTVDATQFTYGPALFIALLLGWGRRLPWRRVALAITLLLPVQVFIVVMQVLREVALPDGLIVTPWFSSFTTDAIAYGYQLSALMLPTVVPVLAWWWLASGSTWQRAAAAPA